MLEVITLRNVDTSQEIVIGDSIDYNYVVPQGGIKIEPISAGHSTFNFPGQIGSTVSFTSIGNRNIFIEGYVIGASLSAIESKKNVLSRFFNLFHTIELRSEGYSVYGKPNSNIKYGETYHDNNEVLVKFLIDLMCTKPLWERSISDNLSLAILVPRFRFPLIMVPKKRNGGVIFGERQKELFGEITNDGANEIGVEIFIRALGVVNNPEIIFVEKGEYIRIKKVLDDGEEIAISTIKGERIINGRADETLPMISYLDYWDETSTWLTLPIGTTTVAFKTKLNGIDDDTYKNIEITVGYKRCQFNLDGE